MKFKIKACFKFFLLNFLCLIVFYNYFKVESRSNKPPSTIYSVLEPYKSYGVFTSAKSYNSVESLKYLDRNLLKKGIFPIQITIHNNSAQNFYLSDKSIDLDNLSASSVANRVHQSYIPRSIALKIASAFFWPFIIPSTIDSFVSFSSYSKMKREYSAKSLKKNGETLIAYSSTHRIIFVEDRNIQNDLTLFLKDTDTGKNYSISTKIDLS